VMRFSDHPISGFISQDRAGVLGLRLLATSADPLWFSLGLREVGLGFCRG
jgi:hypothetical protein